MSRPSYNGLNSSNIIGNTAFFNLPKMTNTLIEYSFRNESIFRSIKMIVVSEPINYFGSGYHKKIPYSYLDCYNKYLPSAG